MVGDEEQPHGADGERTDDVGASDELRSPESIGDNASDKEEDDDRQHLTRGDVRKFGGAAAGQ